MTRRVSPHERWTAPSLPIVEVSKPRDGAGPGFLALLRRQLQITYPNGEKSAPFPYDEVDRAALDAVVIAAYFFQKGRLWIYLRSAIRPPLAFRRCAAADPLATGASWELPAGLIEADESGEAGVLQAAARELREELGFSAKAADFHSLGEAVIPCGGIIAEQQFFVRLEVTPGERTDPSLDGSPLEEFGKIIAVPVQEALQECRDGIISDSKTEIGLRRLWEDCQRGLL